MEVRSGNETGTKGTKARDSTRIRAAETTETGTNTSERTRIRGTYVVLSSFCYIVQRADIVFVVGVDDETGAVVIAGTGPVKRTSK